MTIQTLISTKNGLIIGSDRASTTADGKTYEGVHKIFNMSEKHSSVIMINSNPEFEEVPMKTLIGESKQVINLDELLTIGELKEKFFKFVEKNTPKESLNDYLEDKLRIFEIKLRNQIYYSSYNRVIKSSPKKEVYSFLKSYSNYEHEFDHIIPKNKNKKEELEKIWQIFSHDLQSYVTGVILSGYNIKSHFPTFYEFQMIFNSNKGIVYEDIDCAIDSKDPIIKIFAVNNEGYAFITGVNMKFVEFILNTVEDLNENVADDIMLKLEEYDIENKDLIEDIITESINNEYSGISEDIDDFRNESIKYTSNSIEYLPMGLLCVLGELLVRLTAVKQKTSSDAETVSMSNDIVTTTKTDGIKWIDSIEDTF